MPPSPRRFGLVVLWMAGALLSFCVVAVSIRALAGRLTVFEILALRNVGGLVLLGAMALAAPDPARRLAPAGLGVHLTRNVVHFAGQALWAYGLTVLPLATVFAIEFTTPAWVALFAVAFLGERMTGPRLVSLVLGFVGVVIIVRPGLAGFRPEALAVALAAVCFGVQLVTAKVLTGVNSTWTILMWMNLVQLPLNLAADRILGQPLWFPAKLDAGLWLPAVAIAVCGLSAHYCLTNAFRHGDAIVVVPIDFLRVPLIALVGFLVYREVPEAAVLIGAGVVIAGVFLNIYAEARPRGR